MEAPGFFATPLRLLDLHFLWLCYLNDSWVHLIKYAGVIPLKGKKGVAITHAFHEISMSLMNKRNEIKYE